jgi:hypothetical protein
MEPKEEQPKEEQPKEEMQKKEEIFCKYNEATERCIFNPDSTASANDDKCYKTDKNRCASKKKKMMKIKIKPKKANKMEEAKEAKEAEEATQAKEAELETFCKYNEATERCIFNPDSTASANDDKCYKTDKNRCASKKTEKGK